MTPSVLMQAWEKGLPLRGQFQLTLSPRVVGNAQLCELVAIRFDILAEVVTKAIAVFQPGFALTVVPQPRRGADWAFDYALSHPATDAMALLLSGLDAVSRSMGGDLFTNVDVRGHDDALVPHQLAMLPVPEPALQGADGAPLTPATLPKMRGAEVFIALPATARFDNKKMWDALLALSSLVEEGCFDPADLDDERPFVTPLIGHDPTGQWHNIGLNFFPGDAAIGPVVVSFVSRVLGRASEGRMTLTVQFAG